jgi:hypothetical protein
MRQTYGAYDLLLTELRTSDEPKDRGFVRCTPHEFDELLAIVRSDITGSSRFRLPILADIRLATTLRFLATDVYNIFPIAVKAVIKYGKKN